MLEVDNRTPFVVGLLPSLDREGREHATVAVKGTFSFSDGEHPEPLPLASEQRPLVQADEPYDDEAGSVRYESESCPLKPATDVVLVGHAYGPGGRRVTLASVTVSVADVNKTVRVTGDRAWTRTVSGWLASDPLPFERIPLRYERAYGGADLSQPDDAGAFDPRNPVGTGFTTGKNEKQIEGLRLPNLEDPAAAIRTPFDRPPVASFGWVGRAWVPRSTFGGTYDDAWSAERNPLLPLDFDERFYQGAAAGMVSPRRLRGGEPIVVTGASPLGRLRMMVPARALSIVAVVRGQRRDFVPEIETVVIEPDDGRLTIVWKTTFACPNSFLRIDYVRVREAA